MLEQGSLRDVATLLLASFAGGKVYRAADKCAVRPDGWIRSFGAYAYRDLVGVISESLLRPALVQTCNQLLQARAGGQTWTAIRIACNAGLVASGDQGVAKGSLGILLPLTVFQGNLTSMSTQTPDLGPKTGVWERLEVVAGQCLIVDAQVLSAISHNVANRTGPVRLAIVGYTPEKGECLSLHQLDSLRRLGFSLPGFSSLRSLTLSGESRDARGTSATLCVLRAPRCEVSEACMCKDVDVTESSVFHPVLDYVPVVPLEQAESEQALECYSLSCVQGVLCAAGRFEVQDSLAQLGDPNPEMVSGRESFTDGAFSNSSRGYGGLHVFSVGYDGRLPGHKFKNGQMLYSGIGNDIGGELGRCGSAAHDVAIGQGFGGDFGRE